MTDPYLLTKWVHIVSSTVLFGTGLGTAFHLWATHWTGNPTAIAAAARNTVRADWLFTLPSGIVQPVSGYVLVRQLGYDPRESWIVAALGLYALAGACWVVVVRLQIDCARVARQAVEAGRPLPAGYHWRMRAWFALGWPAFIGLLIVFWLMIAKPVLW
jgi:uncharacterized membrane protein